MIPAEAFEIKINTGVIPFFKLEAQLLRLMTKKQIGKDCSS